MNCKTCGSEARPLHDVYKEENYIVIWWCDECDGEVHPQEKEEKCYLCDKVIETEAERTCISEGAHKVCVREHEEESTTSSTRTLNQSSITKIDDARTQEGEDNDI